LASVTEEFAASLSGVGGDLYGSLRTALFWVITQRVVVISYHYSLHNNPEDSSSLLLRGGSPKSRISKPDIPLRSV